MARVIDRRSFIETVGRAAGSAAALGVLPGMPGILGLPGLSDRGWSRRDDFRLWAWVHGGAEPRDGSWAAHFARLASAGFHGVLVGGGDGPALAAAAHDAGLAFHRWIWVLNRNGDEWARENHPEWFTVSRNGESSLTHPPYVGYYRWVCPRRTEVRDYLRDVVRRVAREEGVDGVHLDYIRYPDVILPRGLWEKYDLVQDTELPEFDFCYCDACRDVFRQRHGIDPLDLSDPPADLAWREFRWESVTLAVRDIAEVVAEENREVTAAVFPTPNLARRLVRQEWETWPLDAVFPMIYHSFYEEPVSWVSEATRKGIDALAGRRPLYTGLYLPALTPEELAQAVAFARDGGASGAALFESGGLTDEHLDRLAFIR